MLAMAGITGRPGTEDDQSDGGPRVDAANYTRALAQQGVRSSVVRLAPMVHSDLDHHGFTSALIGFARETRSVTTEEAPRYLGFLAGFAGLDNPVSNDKTRRTLGWEPTHPAGSRTSRPATTSAELTAQGRPDHYGFQDSSERPRREDHTMQRSVAPPDEVRA
jgi:hypothetical protein